MLHAVIMAGGSGTRFWPASRQIKPKQLLKMGGARTMLQTTFDRLNGLVSSEHVLVLTNQQLTDAVVAQLPDLPVEHIVGEPCKRDTAPCIGVAASLVQAADKDGIMVVMPSDHVIEPRSEFHRAIKAGVKLIEQDPSRIVTFGIRPTYAAESFGYIQRGAGIDSVPGIAAFSVERFREKPNRATAEEYMAAGTFYWNSGIFLWKASTILEALESFEPEIYNHIENIAKGIGTKDFQTVFATEFAKIQGKSIDFAVMERHQNVCVIEAPFAWDDVGSWQAIARLIKPDGQGNAVDGPYLPIDSSNMIIRSEADHLIVTIGMKDTIVVHTQDATLVAPKEEEERVRDVVKQLTELGHQQYL
ncbi:Mannose-1-phosphate guanylyltransferase RfbM [Pirellula sp. SH-Sr6A]|uniref:mannose-1-phosphate guanylyltransferase n=1 Tax=Pirellula sp. SH-Sr6A TaxID=1632865 RepID=UPI00078D70CE|nr:mannose-1-phosphate guanylyltransferase [Pirellula sp. SH-Sr6A]AMV33877.1 Mannose-1-phosphate guanylyltransferase RfbM [Pirellula sp. SH-Sr6A]